MTENEIAKIIVDVVLQIHKGLADNFCVFASFNNPSQTINKVASTHHMMQNSRGV